MNKFIFMGRLTAAPEYKKAENDRLVATFSVAVNRRYKNANGEQETDFFNCVIFGKAAEVMHNLNIDKGTKLLFESEVRNNNYTDGNGVKHYGFRFIVKSFEFCESKAKAVETYGTSNNGNRYNAPPTNSNSDFDVIYCEDDDLPF